MGGGGEGRSGSVVKQSRSWEGNADERLGVMVLPGRTLDSAVMTTRAEMYH
jgi:hypothetical protein